MRLRIAAVCALALTVTLTFSAASLNGQARSETHVQPMTAFPQHIHASFDTALPEVVHDVEVFQASGDLAELESALRGWQISGSGDLAFTESALRELFTEAGWPSELHEQALAVSWCESRWKPDALGIGGTARGLFQIHLSPWFPYAQESTYEWADPLVNARVAWDVYQYDLARGYAPWTQWECKP